MRGGPAAKRRGSAFEREVARMLDGKRTPLSGGAGGNDLTFATDSLWGASWGFELKRRARLPVFLTTALMQARVALPLGSPKKPALVLREDHGQAIFACYLDDLRVWVEALAEMGQGARVKALARQVQALGREIEGMA